MISNVLLDVQTHIVKQRVTRMCLNASVKAAYCCILDALKNAPKAFTKAVPTACMMTKMLFGRMLKHKKISKSF
uniref:Uncharacterized protein n=1 Tax=Acrobeloides nanus TaxID=290746 RepID=A0A914BWL4_9BILA